MALVDVQDGGHQDMGDISVKPTQTLGGITFNAKTNPAWYIGGAVVLLVVYQLMKRKKRG